MFQNIYKSNRNFHNNKNADTSLNKLQQILIALDKCDYKKIVNEGKFFSITIKENKKQIRMHLPVRYSNVLKPYL